MRLAKEAHGREDGDHLVVMGEIDVDGAIEREGDGRVVQRVVDLGVVLHGGFCQTSEELVDISHTLYRPERLAVAMVE